MVVVYDLFIACSLVVILWRLLFVNVVLVVVVMFVTTCVSIHLTHIVNTNVDPSWYLTD